jgi:hypothetical protein
VWLNSRKYFSEEFLLSPSVTVIQILGYKKLTHRLNIRKFLEFGANNNEYR